ncbi:MAG: class I SAM-dependent methyltransferase [Flavobacteriales bacterium]|nr:class I SAM-dependent methyltransferase [Flavobacteriales bacterium]MCB9365484.1 class I SAM-dependent methyltransferase [Flavobacteriales bacterium]
MKEFNPKDYWETRLQKSFNLNGVGDIGLGVNYNNALYDIRKYAFHKLMKSISVQFSEKSVMDIGSGTGFYIERWKELNVKSIQGTDITNVVVKNLSEKFPNASFKQLDIGEKLEAPKPTYDFISAFDVLFHIVDDTRFEQAITNIYSLLNKEGYFVISDNFVHGKTKRLEHQVSRSYEFMTETITKTGFKHVKTIPMFVLMNDPVDTESKVVKKIFWLITKNVRKGERMGKIIGGIMKPIEKLLISLITESPSTEIKIYQKI